MRKADNAVIPIKAVTPDDAKTGVTIDTFVDMADGKEYTFTYTAKDEAKTVSTFDLTVTSGKVEKLDLTTTNVTAATADDGVKVVTKDANDVILNTYTFSEAAGKYITVTVTPTTVGYRDGNKIYLPEVGNTATVKVEYHTYKFVDGKEEGAFTETFTVTAVADATVMSNFVYTITDTNTSEPAWSSASFKEKHQVAIGDTAYAYFLFKDSKGNNKTKDYKVSSSDSSVLIVSAKKLSGSADSVQVNGAKEGTAYIVVKNSKDELVTTLPVTVAAKRTPTTMELDNQAVTVSNSTTAGAIKTVKICVKDQYGDKIANASFGTAVVTPLSAPTGVDVTTMKTALVTSLGNISTVGTYEWKIDVTGSNYPLKGSYVYKIELKKGDKTVTNSLTVNVSEPAAAGSSTSYVIELASDSIDLVADKDNMTEKKMQIKIAQLEGGVTWKYLTVNSIASISVKSSDEKSTLHVVSAGATTETCGAVVTSGTSVLTKEAKADTTYVVKVTLQGGKDLTAAFTTKDSQPAVSRNITNISDSITATDIASALTCSTADGAKNHIEYFYDNQKLNITTSKMTEIKAASISGQKDIYVESVKINVPVATGLEIVVEVPVQKVFTTTASGGWTTSSVSVVGL